MTEPNISFAEPGKYTVSGQKIEFNNAPESDPNWKCYLFGNKPGSFGMVYIPRKGQVPNWFVRWMMRVCLGCTWIKEPPK